MWKSVLGAAALIGILTTQANAVVVAESSLIPFGNTLPAGTTGVNGFLNGAGFLSDSFDSYGFTLAADTFLTLTLKGTDEDLGLFLWQAQEGRQPLGLAGNDVFNVGSACANASGLSGGDSCLSLNLGAGEYGVTVTYDDTTLPRFGGGIGLSGDDGILDTPFEIVPGVSRFGGPTNYQLRFSEPVSTVSAVPVPAALPLLGTAFLGFSLLCRRRSKAVHPSTSE